MWQKSYNGTASLFLVPTPIGNMEDITYRAVKILNDVEVIFSEDTRVTINLLKYYNISKRLIALHDNNEDIIKEKVLNYLKNEKNVAIVSDRGTPLVSDPGYKTVRYIINMGYNVIALPGANALIPALISSGFESKSFLFYGFMSSNVNKQREELNELVDILQTIIFYEAPHRIRETLRLMLEIFGDRKICLAREISKKFESFYRGKISELLVDKNEIKGEIVLVLEGNKEEISVSNMTIEENVNIYIKSGLSLMDAIKKVSKDRKMKKSDVYNEYHRRNK